MSALLADKVRAVLVAGLGSRTADAVILVGSHTQEIVARNRLHRHEIDGALYGSLRKAHGRGSRLQPAAMPLDKDDSTPGASLTSSAIARVDSRAME
nr:hypothetical protein [Nitrosomonas nitrosa]